MLPLALLKLLGPAHNGAPDECYILGYNTVSSAESQPTFRRNIPSPSSGLKNKPSKIPAGKQPVSLLPTSFQVGILLGLFDHED
jgi:hypothetical protein